LDSLEFEGAFVQGGGVAVYADGQFEPQFVLGFDHFAQGALMRFLRGFVVNDHGLELLDEPVDDRSAKNQEQEERRQKKPAVVHAGRVVNGFQKLGCVHVCHGLTYGLVDQWIIGLMVKVRAGLAERGSRRTLDRAMEASRFPDLLGCLSVAVRRLLRAQRVGR
jgi:hypothetical protein